MSQSILSSANQRRLLWRCRRGLLELDIVLQRFITAHFATLTLGELQQLEALLDLTDNECWAVINGDKGANFQSFNGLVLKINDTKALNTSRMETV